MKGPLLSPLSPSLPSWPLTNFISRFIFRASKGFSRPRTALYPCCTSGSSRQRPRRPSPLSSPPSFRLSFADSRATGGHGRDNAAKNYIRGATLPPLVDHSGMLRSYGTPKNRVYGYWRISFRCRALLKTLITHDDCLPLRSFVRRFAGLGRQSVRGGRSWSQFSLHNFAAVLLPVPDGMGRKRRSDWKNISPPPSRHHDKR